MLVRAAVERRPAAGARPSPYSGVPAAEAAAAATTTVTRAFRILSTRPAAASAEETAPCKPRCAASGTMDEGRASSADRRTVPLQPAAAAADILIATAAAAAAAAAAHDGFAVTAVSAIQGYRAAATAAARDSERDIARRDHEAAPASSPAIRAAPAGASYRNAQHLARSQLNVAADISPQPTFGLIAITPTRADGFDVVESRYGHRIGDDTAGRAEGGCRSGQVISPLGRSC